MAFSGSDLQHGIADALFDQVDGQGGNQSARGGFFAKVGICGPADSNLAGLPPERSLPAVTSQADARADSPQCLVCFAGRWQGQGPVVTVFLEFQPATVLSQGGEADATTQAEVVVYDASKQVHVSLFKQQAAQSFREQDFLVLDGRGQGLLYLSFERITLRVSLQNDIECLFPILLLQIGHIGILEAVAK